MSDQTRIDELMLQWESLRQRGEAPTVDFLCGDETELADSLQEKIDVVERMESIMGVHSPHHDSSWVLPTGDESALRPPVTFPRTIPGYELLEVVGCGGMGVVYRAQDLKLHRTVAVKMLHGAALPKQLHRFHNEAKLIANLNHPNIVEIYEFGEYDGIPFFSMEFIETGSLQDRLEEGPLEIDDVVRLVETLASAVQFAHDNNVIHRDLKPANVLLKGLGPRPTVSDFGLAKQLEDDSGHTRTGEVLGTLAYMAPEQLEHNPDSVDHRVDVYSLGTILYETLTGQPPFEGMPAVIMRKLLTEDPVEPSKIRTSIPRDLEAICLKCLEKTPDDRYQSPQELADDLRDYREGRPISARPSGVATRVWKWSRRRPHILIPLVLLLCGLAAIPIYNLVQQQRTHAELRARAEGLAPQAAEILRRNCFECHGFIPELAERDLNVLDHQSLIDSERRLVVPGVPGDSRLMQRIADGSMPPETKEKNLPRLCEEELSILRTWIAGGAPAFDNDAGRSTAPVVTYSPIAADVRVIFIEYCYKCHKFDVAKGGIKILNHRLLVNQRKVVVPGDADQSELFHLITRKGKGMMPPPKEKSLSEEDIATIKEWINEGAPPFPKAQ